MSDVAKRIDDIITKYPVTLFMKGTNTQPMCGFSAQVVNVLHEHGTDFHAVNVLDDETLREGIKEYSNWPTIPQLYVRGEFVGGCDIVMKLHRDGKIKEVLQQS